MQTVGATWLSEHFQLGAVATVHRSFIDGRRQTTIKADGTVEETFTRYYWPGDHPLDHVEFLLKYDGINLDLLEQVFRQLPTHEVDGYIAQAPTSKYRRRIGFLYEFLTDRKLSAAVGGNLVPILDPERYFTGTPVRISRWRVSNNLLGGPEFCVTIRRTPAIEKKLAPDWPAEIRRLTQNTDPRQWTRAVSYLYLKETKASFAIEREEVTPERGERFVAVLARSGTGQPAEFFAEARLTELQNIIVDPRYAEKGFRQQQNFVGQTLPNFQEKVHYVCPLPTLVPSLIAGLSQFRTRAGQLPAPLRAAVASFGFVYVHPFLDGNGRLHRLLLHDSLAQDGYTDPGLVLPFSSVMLRDSVNYDRVLESVSKIVTQRVRYRLERDHTLVVENAADATGVWRYLDLTAHVEYVLDLIEVTVRRDLPDELNILEQIDRLTSAIKTIVDLPSRKLGVLLSLLRDSRGKLSARKRSSTFAELTDAEVRAIEAAYDEVFPAQPQNPRPERTALES